MSDEDALLAAIAANPDEDTPRLVYADWLDEHDQHIRAEFIRVQIEVARVETLPRVILNRYVDLFKRQQELLDNHVKELAGRVAHMPSDVTFEFHRGFVSEVSVDVWRFMHHADEIASLQPFPHIRGWGVASYLAASREEPNVLLKHLAKCFAIEMHGQHGWDRTSLFASDIRALFGASPSWNRLVELSLAGCEIGDLGLSHLVDMRIPLLADLDLSENDLTDAAVTSLLDSGQPPQLSRLVLGGNPIGNRGAIALAERWPTGDRDNLKHLNLRFTNIGTPGQQALLARFGGRIDLF